MTCALLICTLICSYAQPPGNAANPGCKPRPLAEQDRKHKSLTHAEPLLMSGQVAGRACPKLHQKKFRAENQ